MEEKKSPEREQDIERSIKKGIKTPRVRVVMRILLLVLVITAIATFTTALMRYSELQREKEALEDKVNEYEAEVEKLEYLIDSPVDYDYIVRIAKEKLNLYLPDEIIYNNDTNQ